MNPDASNLELLLSEKQIQEEIGNIAADIDCFFGGREIIVIGVLKGALFFMADLLRSMKTQSGFDLIQAKSYEGTTSAGEIKILKEPSCALEGKEILLVEDILDTGITATGIKKYLTEKGAEKIYVCSLLNKKGRRIADIEPDFCGFEIDNLFVVGYGLDYNEKFRELRDIYVIA